jgi:hypothetical protein
VARDHHHLGVDLALAQPLQRHDAIDTRQPHIEHDDVIRGPGGAFETLFPARRRLDLEPFVAQHAAQRGAHARFVVNYKDGRHGIW